MDQVLTDTKKYQDLAEKRSVFYRDVDRALELVRKHIIQHNRILYGGMAIDLALKAAGHKGIYADDAIPDYDFMSPDYYNESNGLAWDLHNAGFENVSSIHAIHISSRRVRVNYIPVADITYIPENIYLVIPTIEVQGLRIVHPYFQYLDMFRAMNTPYEKPPGEVILQRTKKDIKRYKLLAEAYPLSPAVLTVQPIAKMQSIPLNTLHDCVLGGYAAYAVLYKFWSCLNIESADVLPLQCEFSKTAMLVQQPYASSMITLITDNYEKTLETVDKKDKQDKKDKKDKIYFNKYLDDLRPRSIHYDIFEIYDNYGRKLPVYKLSDLVQHWLPDQSAVMNDVYVCQSYYVLLYLLLAYTETKDDMHLAYYNSMLHMIATAETYAADHANEYSHIPMFLTYHTYGEANISPDYIISTREHMATVFGMRDDIRNERGAFGYYPERGPDWEEFDPSTNVFFAIDGKKCEPFQPLMQLFMQGFDQASS
jgi:hypothetical protein